MEPIAPATLAKKGSFEPPLWDGVFTQLLAEAKGRLETKETAPQAPPAPLPLPSPSSSIIIIILIITTTLFIVILIFISSITTTLTIIIVIIVIFILIVSAVLMFVHSDRDEGPALDEALRLAGGTGTSASAPKSRKGRG